MRIIFAPSDISRDKAHAQWPIHVTEMWLAKTIGYRLSQNIGLLLIV